MHETSSSPIGGLPDNRQTTVHYDGIEVTWSQGGNPDSRTTISRRSIIAVFSNESGPGSGYTVLFTRNDATRDDQSKKSNLRLETLNAFAVPSKLVQDFKPSARCHWLGRYGNIPPKTVRRHVVVSTGSGTGLSLKVWNCLLNPLLTYLGLAEYEDYQVHTTNSDTSVSEFAKAVQTQANEGIEQSLLILSGDGGIVDMANTLCFRHFSPKYVKPRITLLPLGTGNALANSSGIADDDTLGLHTMLCGSPGEIPIFRAKFSPNARLLVNEGREERALDCLEGTPTVYGAVVCSWGHHAALVADSDTAEYRKFGSERFQMAAKEALFPSDGSAPHAYEGQVSVRRSDKAEWESIPGNQHGYVLATFVSQLEAGFTISPASKPLDEKLRLIHFRDLNGKDAMDVMSKAFDGGKHVDDDKVGYEEVRGLRIDFNEDDGRWRRVCVDGKIIRVDQGGWVEVLPMTGGIVDLVAK